MKKCRAIVCLLGLSLALAACQNPEALDIPPPLAKWQPEGVNAANIAAMAVHPYDVVRGHGDPRRVGGEAALPVRRLWQDRVKPLPGSMLGSAGAPDSPPSGGSAGAPPADNAAPPPSGGAN